MNSNSKILITGVTGQDGSNMVRYLLKIKENIQIFGCIRRLSVLNHENIKDINDERFQLINLDITDQQSIINNIKLIKPDYVINFAAQSFVGESWNTPIQTFTTNTLSVMYFLEAIRLFNPKCRFYSAGSSEEFGNIQYTPQNIIHPLKPKSPYGASKCAARHIVNVYRDSYNLFAIHCILFNHEGIRRGKHFVTRKITSEIARIREEIKNKKKVTPFEIGNIYIKRDWSDSEDFVEAIWLMLNMDTPKEYVLSSNETHTIKEFIEIACKVAELEIEWIEDKDNYLNTKLISNGQVIMKINKKFYRLAEIDTLCGDSTETMKKLNWKPKVTFPKLVEKMVKHDIKLLENK